jgi:hypothetical protein
MTVQRKPVKLVKKSKSAKADILAEVVVVENRSGWSRAIQSWIKEFRQRDRHQSLPAFDSLFKDALNTDPGLRVKKGALGAEAE